MYRLDFRNGAQDAEYMRMLPVPNMGLACVLLNFIHAARGIWGRWASPSLRYSSCCYVSIFGFSCIAG